MCLSCAFVGFITYFVLNFQVGFFPSECVEVIGGSRKSTSSVISTTAVPEEEKLPGILRDQSRVSMYRMDRYRGIYTFSTYG